MISFSPDRIDYFDMDAHTDDVWILYRLNHQSCLIIGVFDSREAAFTYTEKNGPTGQSGWIEPRPGQRHWQYDTDMFTYFLEQHHVRQGVGMSPRRVEELSVSMR